MLPFEPATIDWRTRPVNSGPYGSLIHDYGPVAESHLASIGTVQPEERRRLDHWLRRTAGHVGQDRLTYPVVSRLLLDDAMWNSEEGVQSVRAWLYDIGIPFDTPMLLWYDHEMHVIPWKLIVRYWDALAWPAGYAMTAIDCTLQQAVLFHHENVIEHGRYATLSG